MVVSAASAKPQINKQSWPKIQQCMKLLKNYSHYANVKLQKKRADTLKVKIIKECVGKK
jgi:hypothetical protein